MKFLVLLILIQLPFSARGESCQPYLLEDEAKEIFLCKRKEEGRRVFASENCGDNNCLAMKAFQKRNSISTGNHGGHDPGVLACKKLKGEISFAAGKTGFKDSVLLCKFSDRSYITHFSLTPDR
jgi:hypothetical protein